MIQRVPSARQSRRLRLQPSGGPVLHASEAVVPPEMPGGYSVSQAPAVCLQVQPVPCTPRPVGNTSRLFPPTVASDQHLGSHQGQASPGSMRSLSSEREQCSPEVTQHRGPARPGSGAATAEQVLALCLLLQPHPWGTLSHHPHFQITQRQAPGDRGTAGLRSMGEVARTLASPRCWLLPIGAGEGGPPARVALDGTRFTSWRPLPATLGSD